MRGDVQVFPETDDPQRFADLQQVYLGPNPEQTIRHDIEAVRFQPNKRGTLVLLKLKTIADRTQADALHRLLVFARQADLPPLEPGELFLHDLIGMAVQTEAGAVIGTLKDIQRVAAYNLFVVERTDQPDALIPDVPEFVQTIDADQRVIIIRPIEGLLD